MGNQKTRFLVLFIGCVACFTLLAQPGLTLHAQNIPVRPLIEKISNVLHDNIVMTSDVAGKISLNLERVPWPQALSIVLKTEGLVADKQNSITIIMPEKRYAEQKQASLVFQKKVSELVPLHSESLAIHYASAKALADLFSRKDNGFLSARGKVSYDDRTNTLLLEGIPSKLKAIKRLATQLDVPIKQVLIKARIVNLDRKFEHEVGVRFGLSRPAHLSGTLKGANALAAGQNIQQIKLADRLNVDMPATTLFNHPGSMGLAVAKIGAGVMVDLELSAMEKQHLLKVVASPRLIASHAGQAVIESGTEIPYEQQAEGGATSATFKKAVLSLSVKPQITQNNQILLTLSLNQDKPGELTSKGLTIKTEHMKTQLLISNKQTVVVGGIYETTQQNTVDRVPFFSALPIVGHLFMHKIKVNNRHELLIFITPEILN